MSSPKRKIQMKLRQEKKLYFHILTHKKERQIGYTIYSILTRKKKFVSQQPPLRKKPFTFSVIFETILQFFFMGERE